MPSKLKIVKTNAAAVPDGLVDSGFNNPDGSSNTYGIVGGATSITGEQILPRVAIAKPAVSGTLYTTAGNATAYGMVTNLSFLSANSAVGYVDSTGSTVDLGKVSGSVPSGILLAITNTVATGSFIVTSGNAQTSGGAGTPVWFDTTFNAISVNTPYYIKSVANATHFTVSTTLGGPAVAVTTQNGITANLNQQPLTLAANATETVADQPFVYADNAAGYILRQRGKRKFLVADGTTVNDENIVTGSAYRIVSVGTTDWQALGAGPDAAAGKVFTATANGTGLTTTGTAHLVGVCKTANLANNALTLNTMNILATKADTNTVYVDGLTSHQITDFTNNGTDQNSGTHFYATFNGAFAANAAAGINYAGVDIRSA